MHLKKKFAALFAGTVLASGMALVAAPYASASVSGTVTGEVDCVYGNYSNVVGIWVDAANGADGWATTSNDGVGGKFFSYTLTASSSSYSLHIGCGGTKQDWAHTYYKYGITQQDIVLACTSFDGCVG